ncbi:MAG: DUF503 domain-containing protein [Actinomycetota bacterium]
MFVGFARFDLRLAGCDSLKEKRSVLRRLQAGLSRNFACAVAEVEYQDLRQRAAVGVSVVSGTHFQARKILAEIGRRVQAEPEVEIIETFIDVIRPEDR